MRHARAVCVGAWLACLSLAVAAPANAEIQRDWFTLTINGVRTGYSLDERIVDGKGTTEREATTIVLRQLGHRSRIERIVSLRSDRTGTPLSYRYELHSGTTQDSWEGTFAGNRLTIRSRSNGKMRELVVAIPSETPLSPRRSAWFSVDGDVERQHRFDPASKSTVDVNLRVAADASNERHVSVSSTAVSSEDAWFDEHRQLTRLRTTLLGQPLTWTPCRADCDARVDEPMDAIGSPVVASPVHIPDWHRHRTLRYVIARSDGESPIARETPEQSVVYDDKKAIITVCDECGYEADPTPQELAHYRQPNAWVESDDAEIHHIAQRAVGGGDVEIVMRSLVEFVEHSMRGNNDFLGYADAVTALHTGSGDCTEFSVLLSALARARGIPARIAVGLAYSDRFSGRKNVFSPHTWVQVWTGQRWKSYDAALDSFDSTHIVLGVSDGDPTTVNAQFSQLPMLRIEKAGVVKDG